MPRPFCCDEAMQLMAVVPATMKLAVDAVEEPAVDLRGL
jgi:hypothetical protein